MEIRNNRELRAAYSDIQFYKEMNHKVKGINHYYAREVKTAIRSYLKKESDSRIIHDDGDGSGYIELVTLPETITTKEEAEEYTQENIVIPEWNSAYDCTGKAFEYGTTICKRNGRYYVYHRVGYDV